MALLAVPGLCLGGLSQSALSLFSSLELRCVLLPKGDAPAARAAQT